VLDITTGTIPRFVASFLCFASCCRVQYLSSSEEYYDDYLLHVAASRSLDLIPIESILRVRVEEALTSFQELKSLADKNAISMLCFLVILMGIHNFLKLNRAVITLTDVDISVSIQCWIIVSRFSTRSSTTQEDPAALSCAVTSVACVDLYDGPFLAVI